jgi:neutral ceramidase
MSCLQIGFARQDITAPLGVNIGGYYVPRIAVGILDRLYANTLAVSDGETSALLFSLDQLSMDKEQMDIYRNLIAEAAGIPYEAVFIACTHSHTTPLVNRNGSDTLYADLLGMLLCDAAKMAFADLKPAKLGIGRGTAKKISFIRRYRMKDGSLLTNPGVNNPDIVEPVGTPDDMVQVVHIWREGGDDIAIVNFQVHPDTIGGCCYSADYPGFIRATVESAIPGTRCIYFNGAEGDTNHVNVFPEPGDLNGLVTETFDDVARGYTHSRHMGLAIAGAVLQVYEKAAPVSEGKVHFLQQAVDVPSQKGDPSQLPEAERIIKLHDSGRDDQLPYRGMLLTTVVAEAHRIKNTVYGPDSFKLYVTGISFGDVAFVGIPGEPFTDVGISIKSQSPFTMTIPCCLANGSEGYYPMRSAYEEGGYEARSSMFQPGVAETLIERSVTLLKDLYSK